MWKEFKEFAFRGNVVDMAVGVVIGAAFGKIVTAIVDDIFMPVLGFFMPAGDWRAESWTLIEGGADGPAGDMRLLWGDLLGVTLNFLIVAFALFMVVRAINQLKRMAEKPAAPAAAPTTRDCPECLDSIPKAAKRCRSCGSAVPAAA